MAAAAVLSGWNENWQEKVTGALDEVHEVLLTLDVARASVGVGRFANLLYSCRLSLGHERWKDFIAQTMRTHPSFHLFQQDPFTRRSFVKPRGYAGDPALLDFAFEHPASFAERRAASQLGQFLAGISTQGTASRAVRDRRGILARAMDDAANRVRSPKILSVASGHLREVELSHAFCHRRLGRLVAMDHDRRTVKAIHSAYGTLCSSNTLEVHVGGPRDLLSRSFCKRLDAGFDLVFSAGLFDYLSDRFASRLVAAMFDLLSPGGRLLIANFVPELPDAGYMEAFMDWWLIYRTPQQLRALANGVDPHKLLDMRTFRDTTGSIVFLEITRR